jgi:hypothetical protein
MWRRARERARLDATGLWQTPSISSASDRACSVGGLDSRLSQAQTPTLCLCHVGHVERIGCPGLPGPARDQQPPPRVGHPTSRKRATSLIGARQIRQRQNQLTSSTPCRSAKVQSGISRATDEGPAGRDASSPGSASRGCRPRRDGSATESGRTRPGSDRSHDGLVRPRTNRTPNGRFRTVAQWGVEAPGWPRWIPPA